MTGAFEAGVLVALGDVRLQAVTRQVIHALAGEAHSAFGIELKLVAFVGQDLLAVRPQASVPAWRVRHAQSEHDSTVQVAIQCRQGLLVGKVDAALPAALGDRGAQRYLALTAPDTNSTSCTSIWAISDTRIPQVIPSSRTRQSRSGWRLVASVTLDKIESYLLPNGSNARRKHDVHFFVC